MVVSDSSSFGLLLHRNRTSARLVSEAKQARDHLRNAHTTEQRRMAAMELESAIKRLSEWIRMAELTTQ
jgi:hypothetical protein